MNLRDDGEAQDANQDLEITGLSAEARTLRLKSAILYLQPRLQPKKG